MLRSRAIGPRTQIFTALPRGVSKHEGTPRPSLSFETRARTLHFVERVQHAPHRVRTHARMPSRGSSPNRFLIPNSRCQTALLVPAARFLRPGFCILASLTRIKGWAERRETFGCSAEQPLDVP